MYCVCVYVCVWGGGGGGGGGGGEGLWAVSKVESSASARPLSSEVYPDGRLQWHFTCGFDFICGFYDCHL